MAETFISFLFGATIAVDLIIFASIGKSIFANRKDDKERKEKNDRMEQQSFIAEQNKLILEELKRINSALISLHNKGE